MGGVGDDVLGGGGAYVVLRGSAVVVLGLCRFASMSNALGKAFSSASRCSMAWVAVFVSGT